VGPTVANLLADVPVRLSEEQFTALATGAGVRVERIVSTGQSSPPGHWYDQAEAEWVMVVSGTAELEFEGEAGRRRLSAGDWLTIPPHCRHRVAWTDPVQPTVWLAVHFPAA
jgi:cupin 2 domain-containing protein